MLKKIKRKVKLVISKSFKKCSKPPKTLKPLVPSPPPSPSPCPSPSAASPTSPPVMALPVHHHHHHHHHPVSFPFMFPKIQSSVIPDPSPFFSPDLLSAPLPTNSFFQNFLLKNGDQPEYIHPYLVKSTSSSLSLSFPSQFLTSVFIYQVFNPDLTISALNRADPDPQRRHIVSSFSDLSVTLDIPYSNLRFFLARGSPFITCHVSGGTAISITTIHAILSFSSNSHRTKYTITLNNGQTWLLYSSSPIYLTNDISSITSDDYTGIIRIAVLPDSNPVYESTFDRFSSCYPVSGKAELGKPFSLEYRWDKKGWGELLMLAHPLHLRLLSADGEVTVLEDFKFNSIDGELVGVVGDSWKLKLDPISITWNSIKGVREEAFPEIVSALCRDVEDLNPSNISTSSSYFYGKRIARAARLALIAEEVSFPDVIPAIKRFLKETITPWLDGTFSDNGFLYEGKWGGLVTEQGAKDSGADFGFGVYNDHHFHLGYFLYGIAVLAKIDPAWGRKYRPQAYSLMADFMTLGRHSGSNYPRLRCFDLWKMHSWASGLTEFADGRNQESTSEAVNAYYSAALMGLAYGDTHLVAIGSVLAAMEIKAAQTWWQVREGDNIYASEFSRENRVVGVLWSNKRDSGLWFAPREWRECRLGIQVLPLLPITEVLFSDVGFVRELVDWTLPALAREGVGEGWKGFLYAMEGVYDKQGALEKIKKLRDYDDGNSLTNLLWWIYSRGDEEEARFDGGKYCLFGHYCH